MRNKTTAVDDIHLRVAEPGMFRARMTYKFKEQQRKSSGRAATRAYLCAAAWRVFIFTVASCSPER